MAKRAAPDEKPYRPLLDTELVSAALAHAITPPQPAPQTKVVDLPRAEVLPPRRPEPLRQAVIAVEESPTPAQQPLVEKFDQEKRILFTRAESQALDRLVASLASRLNSQVKVSHVMRALASLLLNAEAEAYRRAGEAGQLVRPPNGDAQALQRFEKEIAKIVGLAITDAGPLR